MALTHAVMDYFSDIQRLKDYQKIEHINGLKIKAYETFWLLQRKPIQLKEQLEDDRMLYVNERFLLTRLTSFMLGDDIYKPLVDEKNTQKTHILQLTAWVQGAILQYSKQRRFGRFPKRLLTCQQWKA